MFTDPSCCHTEARSSKYIIKTPSKGVPPREQNEKPTNAAKHHIFSPNSISLTLKVNKDSVVTFV